MIKKLMAVTLSIVVAATLFAGCSKKNDKEITISDPKTKEEALELANQIKDAVDNGTDFDELMNKYSEDTGLSQCPDGYLFTYGSMVAEFEKASFDLDLNDISDVVTTTYGYHIIKRIPVDEKYYDDNTIEVVSAYNGEDKLKEYREELEKNISAEMDNAVVDLSPELDTLLPSNMADFKPDYILKIDDVTITPEEFFFFYYSNIAITQKEIDYFDQNPEDAKKLITDTVDQIKEYKAISKYAKKNNYSLTEDELNSFNTNLSSYITYYYGSEDYFSEMLKSSYTDLDTFKSYQKAFYLKEKIYNEEYGTKLPDGVTKQDVIDYLNDKDKSKYVLVKHILILFPEEAATDTTTAETTSSENSDSASDSGTTTETTVETTETTKAE